MTLENYIYHPTEIELSVNMNCKFAMLFNQSLWRIKLASFISYWFISALQFIGSSFVFICIVIYDTYLLYEHDLYGIEKVIVTK